MVEACAGFIIFRFSQNDDAAAVIVPHKPRDVHRDIAAAVAVGGAHTGDDEAIAYVAGPGHYGAVRSRPVCCARVQFDSYRCGAGRKCFACVLLRIFIPAAREFGAKTKIKAVVAWVEGHL